MIDNKESFLQAMISIYNLLILRVPEKYKQQLRDEKEAMIKYGEKNLR